MSRYHSYINSATAIIRAYNGAEPFASHLKKQFAAHKKFGSKDRKQITQLCYGYFRLGKSFHDRPFEEKLLIGLFFSSRSSSELLSNLKPEWNELIDAGIEHKAAFLNTVIEAASIFPFVHQLSSGIDTTDFAFSHFQQPDLFLRIRPGRKETVLHQLKAADIAFQVIGNDTVVLPNATKIEELIMLNKDAVVQDYSSQRVGEFLRHLQPPTLNLKPSIWDCCAASGGKSIMATDILGEINLTVSDVRESILINLKKRFTEAGIKNYRSNVIDLSHSSLITHHSSFDLIIADVPCTGSGTWGRTPEQLCYFQTESIDSYSTLQKKIIGNVVPSLKQNGFLLYITCSVFEKENEAIVKWIQEDAQLKLIEQKVIKGYTVKADTMFAALLQK
jgi:16S rRNA (cytosine967-C5)-methyltransferase